MHLPAVLDDLIRLRRLLTSCPALRTLTRVHALLVVSSCASSQHLLTSCLATSYARAGDLAAAESTLVGATPSPSSINAWNALVAAHYRAGSDRTNQPRRATAGVFLLRAVLSSRAASAIARHRTYKWGHAMDELNGRMIEIGRAHV